MESSHEGVKKWSCTTCRTSALKWSVLAPARCKGSVAEKWALASAAAAEACGSVGPGHHRMLAGDVVWCLKCGCYGGDRARGLQDICQGKPKDKSGGRLAGQLNSLMKGLHPRTRMKMPESIDENGSVYKLVGTSRREAIEDRSRTVLPSQRLDSEEKRSTMADHRGICTTGAAGKSAAQKHADRLERVRNSDREKARADRLVLPSMRRLRGKQSVGGV